jgi:GNAT superfamily N-acetyltransferase
MAVSTAVAVADGPVTVPRWPVDSVGARLRDGSTAVLRPLGPGETGPLQAVFDGLSAQSRTDRYLVGVPRLTGSMATALTAVDDHRHIAWLATVDDRPAGIARAVRVGPATAELAFEVVDACQGVGLGAALVDALTTAGAVSGIDRVRATVHPSNHRSLHVLALVGLRLSPLDGLLEGESRLRLMERPRIDRTRVARMYRDRHGAADETSRWTTAWARAD